MAVFSSKKHHEIAAISLGLVLVILVVNDDVGIQLSLVVASRDVLPEITSRRGPVPTGPAKGCAVTTRESLTGYVHQCNQTDLHRRK